MSGMAGDGSCNGLWSWCFTGRVDETLVRAALAGVLDRPVVPLGERPDGHAGSVGQQDAVLCDVWYVGGDFPTLVDCYLAPAGHLEAAVASTVAVRLGHDCLLPDDTLNPTRYILAEPDGTLRPVHVEETETDDGPQRHRLRACTGTDPWCATGPGCGPPGSEDPDDGQSSGRSAAAA